MDIQEKLAGVLLASQSLQPLLTADRIKFYKFPDAAAVTAEPIVIFDPLDAQAPSRFGDNRAIAESQLYQVEVWGKDRERVFATAQQLREAMGQLGSVQLPGGVDEYDSDTKVYRIARRYDVELENL